MPDQPQTPGAPQPTEPAQPAPSTDPTPAEPQAQPDGQPTGDQGDKAPFDGPYDEDRAKRLIENLRADNARAKAAASAAEKRAEQQLAAAKKALGLDDGEADDPAAAAQTAQDEAFVARMSLAVHRAAAKAGADPDKLLDSMSFIDSLESSVSADIGTTEFGDQLNAAIKAAVSTNPMYAAGQAPAPSPRSGGDHPGAPGGTGPISEEQLARMSPEAITKALEDGRLAHLL